jgi:hypothetical protein
LVVPGAVRAGALASFEGTVVGDDAAFGEAVDVADLAAVFRRARTGSRLGVERERAVLARRRAGVGDELPFALAAVALSCEVSAASAWPSFLVSESSSSRRVWISRRS